ncbi:hypothetical protein DXG01_008614 [Tephrocybe rancida]|nr:hypothetical protein DXG01_008614 [Tephrocybe rancida]
MAPNEGIFNEGWYETSEQGVFLTFVAPLYMRALKEGKLERFFELLYPIWFDRFPVVLNDHFDDDEPGGRVDPMRQGWVESLQKKFLRKKLLWVGPCQGKEWKSEEYADWESILTLTADHERRRNSYLRYAAFGLYLKGHQWDVIVTKEEREKELSGEGLLQFCLDGIVNDLSYEFLTGPVEEDEENPYGVEFLTA